MSASLVKKSLELFDSDLNDPSTSQSKTKKKCKSAMKMISTKRYGVKKELKRLSQKQANEKEMKLKKRDKKTASGDVYKKRRKDDTDANLFIVKKLMEADATSSKVINKVLKKKKISNSPEKIVDRQKSILFSDNDFDIEEEKDDFWDS